MTVSYEITRVGSITTITVSSSLSGTVYFHWYADGSYLGGGVATRRDFYLDAGELARIEVLDTTDPDFDYVAGAPAGYPARRTIWWVRTLATDCASYRVEQSKNGAAWSTVGIVPHDPAAWEYSLTSERLDDLTDYRFRVVPVDAAGNDGTPVLVESERIVRTPDAPAFDISYDDATDRVTYASA